MRGVAIRFALRVGVNPVRAVPVVGRRRAGSKPSAEAGGEGSGDQYADAPEVLEKNCVRQVSRLQGFRVSM